MNNGQIIDWRKDLLIINFFAPLNQACSTFFQQAYGDPELNVEITHKLDLDKGGLKLNILLQRGPIRILSSEMVYADKQIQAVMGKHGQDLQTMLGMTLGDVCQSMYNGLNQSIYRDYFLKAQLQKLNQNQKENVTVDNEVQAHNSGGQENNQAAGSNPESGS